MGALQTHGILKSTPKPIIYVAYTSTNASKEAIVIASNLRKSGVITDYDLQGRSLGKQLQDASTKGALLTVIVAPDEIKNGQVTLRSMKDGIESKQNVEDLARDLNRMIPPLLRRD